MLPSLLLQPQLLLPRVVLLEGKQNVCKLGGVVVAAAAAVWGVLAVVVVHLKVLNHQK